MFYDVFEQTTLPTLGQRSQSCI